MTFAVTGGGDVTLGAFGSTPNANGASLSAQVLTLQPADATHPGGVSITTQSFGGNKTFTGHLATSHTTLDDGSGNAEFSGTVTADIALISNLVEIVGNGVVSLKVPGGSATTYNFNLPDDAGTSGYGLTSAGGGSSQMTWTHFQTAGNYITALTGDATASGPGSATLTLATVNSNIGTFVATTLNAKGLVTAGANLSGDVTSSGAATSIVATTNATLTTISSLVSVGTITTGTWSATAIALNKGGTGQTTKAPAFDALQPMTTLGDIIYGGASGTGTKLAGNTTTTPQFLTSTGAAAAATAPTWTGSTGSGNVVLATSPTLITPALGTPSALVLTNATGLTSSGVATATFTATTIQKFTSGSGTYTTPTSPRSPLYIRVVMVGGGGAAAGTGTSPGATTNGAASTFGSSLLSAGGGTSSAGATGQVGGSSSLGSGPVGIAITGGSGTSAPSVVTGSGGPGGASAFGGTGQGGTNTGNGGSGIANTGGGAGGAGGTAALSGSGGGGSGGYIDAIITSPSATYSYSVGTGGTGGTAGTGGNAGGSGGSGLIVVYEYYQ